ncbi:MAG: 4Fe-4S binding protein [Candidatus Helarchaeota archaeon]
MPSKKFYSPVLKLVEVCHKCRACVRACPVQAIIFGVGEVIVDRVKCAEYIFSHDNECIECASECHTGALVLKLFEIDENNNVKQIDK